METTLKLIICWVVYFIIHSIFASHFIKRIFKTHLPGLNQYYRAIYNFFALIGLLAIIVYQSTFPQLYFYRPDTGITFLGLGLASMGLIIVKKSFEEYDIREFLGIRQLTGDLEEQGFQRQGLLTYVRHPLYSGSMLFLIGYLIFTPSIINLITVLCMISYFVIGSFFEEKKLIRTFGKKYLDYKKEVPLFIPSPAALIKRLQKAKN